MSLAKMTVCKSIAIDMQTMNFHGLQDFGKDSDENAQTIDEASERALVFMLSYLHHDFY